MKYEAALYAIADSLQMSLYPSLNESGAGTRIRGARPQTVEIGPWSVQWALRVEVDQLGAKYSSAYVKLHGDLWAYFISGMGGALFCLFFDGRKAGVKITPAHKTQATSMRDTLEELRPYAKALMSYNLNTGAWNATTLDAIYPKKKADLVDKG